MVHDHSRVWKVLAHEVQEPRGGSRPESEVLLAVDIRRDVARFRLFVIARLQDLPAVSCEMGAVNGEAPEVHVREQVDDQVIRSRLNQLLEERTRDFCSNLTA